MRRQIDARITRLESYRMAVEGTPASRRWPLIRELMRELAKPVNNESVMEAWARHAQVDYDELRRRVQAHDPSVNELLIDPLNRMLATTELTPAAQNLVAAIVEEQAAEAAAN